MAATKPPLLDFYREAQIPGGTLQFNMEYIPDDKTSNDGFRVSSSSPNAKLSGHDIHFPAYNAVGDIASAEQDGDISRFVSKRLQTYSADRTLPVPQRYVFVTVTLEVDSQFNIGVRMVKDDGTVYAETNGRLPTTPLA